jgi:hypothetical protein
MPYIRNVRTSLTTLVTALLLGSVLYRGVGLAFATPTITPASLCDTSQRALTEASAIRELQVLNPVPCVVQDKPLVEAFLHETIKTDLPPHKIEMEELAFRAVGLIPDDFPYGTRLVEFLVSQIGGYYDPKRKHFVMASWLPATVQHGVAVHELTHALQDQHFGLRKLLNPGAGTTDSDLAIGALIEGDASAVMFDEQSRGASLRKLQDLPSVDSLLLLQVLGVNFGAEAQSVSDALKGLLIFPYTSGLRFAHALLRNGGYAAVNNAYSRPPTSSRQILHPEEFLADSFSPSIPATTELPGYLPTLQPDYTDTLGEFAISAILSGTQSSKNDAATAARGWVGDRLGVFPMQNNERRIAWVTRWETESDAQEFLTAYTAFLASRYSKQVSLEGAELTKAKSVKISRAPKSVLFEYRVRSR